MKHRRNIDKSLMADSEIITLSKETYYRFKLHALVTFKIL